LADLIADGRLDDYLDWQGRYSALIAGTLAPLWSDAITAASRKATAGKVVLYDSNDYVRAWLENRGGELISMLSRESQKAVAMVILLGQSNRMASRDIAKQVRPLIGLNERQAAANLNYREKVYNKYREQGMGEVKARERADKAAIKYAGKQHRFRAETIVHTELAFAYNRGAHMGVGQAIAEGYMGRCAMKWSTAGTNRVCSRCLALKDTIVGYTDESGVTIPPLHPRCRCAIIYDEVEKPRRIDNKPKPAKPETKPETKPTPVINPLLIPATVPTITPVVPPKPVPSDKPDNQTDTNPQSSSDDKVTLTIKEFGEANIPMAKLTKYALNPDKAPDKAEAFEKALGYNLSNVDKLIENIKRNVNEYEINEKPDLGYGRRFQQVIELTGENGKTAKVLLAWILDKNTGEFRLTSIYVDKK